MLPWQQKRAATPRERLTPKVLAAAAAALAGCSLLRAARTTLEVSTQPMLPVNFLGLEKSEVVHIVEDHFPGSMKGSAIMAKLLFTAKRYGFTRTNTVYGQSICSDEINSDRGHLTTLLSNYYGRTFNLGGLGGVPFVGKTGFGAFSAHVPDNGNVFVVFGPHLGYSPDGVPGKFLRAGQSKVSTSCGAISAAYGQLTGGPSIPADAQDMQQSWLRSKLKKHVVDLAGAKDVSEVMVELVKRAYKCVEEEMLDIINTNFGPGKLMLLGGITMNMPYPLPGYFVPLHFSVRSNTMEPKDLMQVFK